MLGHEIDLEFVWYADAPADTREASRNQQTESGKPRGLAVADMNRDRRSFVLRDERQRDACQT
jgi:hypothetical protein